MRTPTLPARAALLEAGAFLATTTSAVALVMAPAQPDAWASIWVGCLALSTSAALWWAESRHLRRALALVVAIAGVHTGFAFDTDVSRVGAVLAILVAVGLRFARRRQT